MPADQNDGESVTGADAAHAPPAELADLAQHFRVDLSQQLAFHEQCTVPGLGVFHLKEVDGPVGVIGYLRADGHLKGALNGRPASWEGPYAPLWSFIVDATVTHPVQIEGLGWMARKHMRAFTGRNASGEEVTVPERDVMVFRPDGAWHAALDMLHQRPSDRAPPPGSGLCTESES
jgi:nucleoid DNA-binding protein